jgi:DNA-binding response OmpR family regulator
MNAQLMEKLSRLTILMVDDNENYLANLSKTLEIFFKHTYTASTYTKALEHLKNRPSIALLDIELDEKSGIELARKLGELSPDTAVIFVSGFSEKKYLMSAIKLQVVDYIIKPATLPILLKSFEKALEKIGSEFFDDIALDEGLVFNQSNQTLFRNHIEVALGAKERLLLSLFISQKGRVLSKEEIASYVWSHEDMSDSALKNLLLELRKKIGKEKIKNVPGAGWTLCIEAL